MDQKNTIKFAKNYHPNALEKISSATDVIAPDKANSLYGLFKQRVKQTPDSNAYIQYSESQKEWIKYTWSEIDERVQQWRKGLICKNLKEGDRVAVLLNNCIEWVVFDLACQSEGIINVPLYVDDRADNMAYIIVETHCKLLLLDNAQHWVDLRSSKSIDTKCIESIIVLEDCDDCKDERVITTDEWLAETPGDCQLNDNEALNRMDQVATIVFTSGTTGRPKGVMLSHGNLLENAYSAVKKIAVEHKATLLSFLPLSHTFERTLGYYYPMMCGGTVCYARSIALLSEDLEIIKPNMMVAVPRIFERVSNKIHGQLDEGSALKQKLFKLAVDVGWHHFLYTQKRATWSPKLLLYPILNKIVAKKIQDKFGGNIEFVICGGAPLSLAVAKTFIGLGINIIQGYGLTETSPVLTGNNLEDNVPESIGLPMIGVEIKLDDNNELLAKGPSIMQGYWNNEEATKAAFSDDGWFKTGDIGRIDESGHIYIVGRVKEILVLSNGKKIPPADIEAAIMEDPLFEQSMVIGEGKPFLSIISVFEKDQYKKLCRSLNLDHSDEKNINSEKVHNEAMSRIKTQLKSFPGYAQIYKMHFSIEPWTVTGDMLTPTLKLKRPKLMKKFSEQIEAMYDGH